MRRRIPRWRGGLAGALVLASVALLAAEPLLLAAATVPLAYVCYGALSRVSPDADLTATRTVGDAQPTPGEPVRVTLRVENTGERPLTDVRVIDGVPEPLAVVDGSPRTVTSLRPGEATTVVYAVMAKRGRYGFDGAAVRVRTLSASEAVTVDLTVEGDGTLTCANTVSDVPLADATLPRAGTLPTDSGGTGLEFYATRRYRRGDPVNRIDWRRYAKTGALTTVEYREEQAVRTVLVVDARPPARTTPEPGYPTGAELSAYAAERLLDALSRTSVVASVAAVGLRDEDVVGGLDPDGLAWAADGGDHAAAEAAAVFDGVGAAADRPAEGPDRAAAGPVSGDGGRDDALLAVLARLPPTAQVVVFSPLVDDWPVALTEALSIREYPTTLVSPSVARGESPGASLVAQERATRLQRAELAGATVIDWSLDDSIDAALRASLAEVFGR